MSVDVGGAIQSHFIQIESVSPDHIFGSIGAEMTFEESKIDAIGFGAFRRLGARLCTAIVVVVAPISIETDEVASQCPFRQFWSFVVPGVRHVIFPRPNEYYRDIVCKPRSGRKAFPGK